MGRCRCWDEWSIAKTSFLWFAGPELEAIEAPPNPLNFGTMWSSVPKEQGRPRSVHVTLLRWQFCMRGGDQGGIRRRKISELFSGVSLSLYRSLPPYLALQHCTALHCIVHHRQPAEGSAVFSYPSFSNPPFPFSHS